MFLQTLADHLEIRAGLHFFYGVNCFQFATGFCTPIFHHLKNVEASAHQDMITYVSVMPGTLAFNPDYPHIQSFEDKNRYLLGGCKEEGMVVCDKHDKMPEGFKKIAAFLFEKNVNDFHFMRQQPDGSWIYKVPASYVKRIADPNDYIKGSEYKQKPVYMMAPVDMVPKSVKMALEAKRFKEWYAPSWPIRSTRLYEVLPANGSPLTFGTGGVLHTLDRKEGTDTLMHVGVSKVSLKLPMPPWPLQEKPVKANLCSALRNIATVLRTRSSYSSFEIV